MTAQISSDTIVSTDTAPTVSLNTPVPANAVIGAATWAGDANSVATITPTGIINIVSDGVVNFTATETSTGVTSSVKLTINKPALTGITVTLAPTSVAIGADSTATYTPIPAQADLGTVVLTSGTPANATVSGNTITGAAVGTSVITATSGTSTGVATITVTATKTNPAPPPRARTGKTVIK